MKEHYKVIVVGAGPAGLSAAINLLDNGISDILVIERFKFPRYKCCAGYITNKTKKSYEKMGLEFDRCHYSLIEDFKIFYQFCPRLKIINKFLYTNEKIDRVELDRAFFELAKSKGIAVLEESKIIGHEPDKNRIILSQNRQMKYDFLIFADGTMGFGCKYQSTATKNIAIQLAFPSTLPDGIDIHFGITKRGYGWVSTCEGTTNVGLTDVYDKSVNYRQIFVGFLNKLHISADVKGLKGAFTPIGIRKPIMWQNVFFVGDAVGACDPLTLSGLRYGLASGAYCAKAIAENNAAIYKKYIRGLKIRFCFMKFLLKAFYLKSVLFLTFNICCRFFGKFVSFVFNNFFVNKK